MRILLAHAVACSASLACTPAVNGEWKGHARRTLCCMQLYVRRHYFYPPSRITQYYENVTMQVRAETQVSIASKQHR